ncbi:hypothetical protein BDQ17DRAFT_1376960 [Cyathus striatus]|nr:hypothetical protein BDQ17DRAFT_1376960 [Cyathus striatus]
MMSPSDLHRSHDYIVLGGGLSGLVLASRLLEDLSVLEAGASWHHPQVRARIDDVDTSSGAFFTSIIGTQYDWAHQTVPQANWVVGSGRISEMNAMYLVRPSSVEMDAWAELLGGMDNDGSGMLPKLAIHAHRNAQIRDIHTFTR